MIILNNKALVKGVDYHEVTVNVAYDIGLARLYFHENFIKTSKGSLVYVDCGNISFECGIDNGKCEVYNSRGYSQGDLARVIIPVEKLEKCWGSFDLESTKNMIDKYLWETPITGTITVDDNEYYITDFINEYGDWENEREVLIKAMTKLYPDLDWNDLISEKVHYEY